MKARTRKIFLAKARKLLLDLGAKQEGNEFILQTRAGRLKLHPSEYEGEEVGTVFGRFDDPTAARQVVDCNRFSGKWNHHYFDGWSVEAAIDDLAWQLRKLFADTDSTTREEGHDT